MTFNLQLRQSSFPDLCPVTGAVEQLAGASRVEERGAVYTRREVVEFILDLTGYTSDRPLHQLKLLEPSFGNGDFLFPAIDRLLCAWKATDQSAPPLETLGNCIRAVELHRDTFTRTHRALIDRLTDFGIEADTAAAIANRWLQHGDFLLTEMPEDFDVVIGNPPYVRQEMIPDVLLASIAAVTPRFTTVPTSTFLSLSDRYACCKEAVPLDSSALTVG